ncbi:MAG: hypothetical protein IPI60_06045 [Saprospiraceae bacterium]|nr:hypothetical protein [Saprospiraceae bacterium]
MIKSIHMQDRQDRIGPLIVTGVFYIWAFRNMISNPDIPQPLTIFTLGICIVLGLCFLINLFSKISLHAAGAGGMIVIAALIWQFFAPYGFAIGSWIIHSSIIVALILIFAGLTGSARLYLKAHNPSGNYGRIFYRHCRPINRLFYFIQILKYYSWKSSSIKSILPGKTDHYFQIMKQKKQYAR